MKITPTLNFAGSCREAIHCYARAFSGEIACLITYREANDPAFTAGMTDAQLDWVYHAELLLDGQRIFLSDHADLALPVCYTNFLTLTFKTAEEVRLAFGHLEEGCRIIYPLEATPFSDCRVVLVDRFGIRWGLMAEKTA